MIFAQGFGPLRGKFFRLLAKLILNRVDLITLRDKDSFDEIQRLGVKKPPLHVTGDPTAILKVPSVEEGRRILSLEGIRQGNRSLLGVAVRSLAAGKETKLYESLAKAIDWLSKEHNYSPVFILFQCPEDMQETSKVIGSITENSNVIFRICRPNEMLALISQLDLLIGMRLHSLVFAAMNDVPLLGISYDPKVEAFMKSINQPYLKLDQILNFQSLKDEIKKILSNREEIKKELVEKRKVLQKEARKNFELFFKL